MGLHYKIGKETHTTTQDWGALGTQINPTEAGAHTKKPPEYIIRFWHIYVQKYPTFTPTYKKMRHEYSMFRCEETIDLCEAKWGSLWPRNRFWDFLEFGFWDFTCIRSVNGVWSDGAGTRRRGHSMRRPGPTQPPGCGCRLVFALPPSGLCLGPATEDVVIASPPPPWKQATALPAGNSSVSQAPPAGRAPDPTLRSCLRSPRHQRFFAK